MPYQKNQSGSVIISILIVTLFITTTLFSLMELAGSNLILAKKRIVSLQAQYAAESGADGKRHEEGRGSGARGVSGGTDAEKDLPGIAKLADRRRDREARKLIVITAQCGGIFQKRNIIPSEYTSPSVSAMARSGPKLR